VGVVDRRSIEEVEAVIRPYVRVTPILEHSGSFKARGAFANLLLRRIPEAGVAAASGGNHGSY